MQYRTEILIPPDRYVCVQLPAYLPEGRAVVTVVIHDAEDDDHARAVESETDRQDIEWWDEFEDDRVTGRPFA